MDVMEQVVSKYLTHLEHSCFKEVLRKTHLIPSGLSLAAEHCRYAGSVGHSLPGGPGGRGTS